MLEWPSREKTKNHPGGFSDTEYEADPKIFYAGETNCPVQYLKKFRVLNHEEEALFQRPKRQFCSNTLRNDERHINCSQTEPNFYEPLYKGHFSYFT